MTNPVLTRIHKERAVHGGVSYSLQEAKELIGLQNYDKVFVYDPDGFGPFGYGAFVFILDAPNTIPDKSGVIINVLSGGILVNEKLYPLLIDNNFETQLQLNVPIQVPLSPVFYNLDINKFRMYFINGRINTSASYPMTSKEILVIDDFGGNSGQIQLNTPNVVYVISDNINVDGITFVISESTTIISPFGKKLYSQNESETTPLFSITNGASLTIDSVIIDIPSKDFIVTQTQSLSVINISVKNCYLNCKQLNNIFDTCNSIVYENNDIYMLNGFVFGIAPSISFNEMSFINNKCLDKNDLVLFDLEGREGGYIGIIDNKFDWNNLNTKTISASSYTKVSGERNIVKGNSYIGFSTNDPLQGITFDNNVWYFENNYGVKNIENTGYATMQITNNTIQSTSGGANVYGFCLFDPAKIVTSELNGFFITDYNFNRIQFKSASQYEKRAIAQININVTFGVITTQNFSFALFKNLLFNDSYRCFFTASSNTSHNISFFVPITHKEGDYFELYYSGDNNPTTCTVKTCQILIHNI